MSHTGITNLTILTLVMKNVDQFTIDVVHSKCDCIQGIISKSIRQPISITFALDKPSGFGIICVPETKQHKKVNISIFNNFTFYLEKQKNLITMEKP